MACVVYQVDKRTGIKYAYSSESYWDKDKKQPRSKRTFLGKVDPVSGNIIPKKSRSSSQTESYNQPEAENQIIASLKKELHDKDALISDLRSELSQISKKYNAAQKALNKINSLTSPFSEE
jgi:predicted RNase H-like nuclease (RuvC/YqgF family)